MIETLKLPNHTECSACHMRGTCTRVVPGSGERLDSKLMIVGEAPGREEDVLGQPFVGASGRLLREMCAGMPMLPEPFFTNVYHCRPINNKIEHAQGSPCPHIWLEAEVKRFKPTVIVATGKTACDFFRPSDTDMPMRWHAAKDNWDEKRKCWIVGMYHPSYALRMGVGEGKRDGNVALVSMITSLQRAMYYLVSAGIVGKEEVREIIETEGMLGDETFQA